MILSNRTRRNNICLTDKLYMYKLKLQMKCILKIILSVRSNEEIISLSRVCHQTMYNENLC